MAVAEAQTAENRSAAPPAAVRVAYLVSRFPKLTETFVLYEILALQDLGIQVELFPLRRERAVVTHADAQAVIDSARFTPLLLSWRLVWAHLYFLATRPLAYAGVLLTLLRANWSSPRYLAGAVAYFPKAVLVARQLQKLRIQHLHAHFASHPAMVAFVIHRLTGIPFSFTAHGSDLHRDRHMLVEKVRAASWVVAISEYNRQVIHDHCGLRDADKVRVIHCGADTETFAYRHAETEFDRGAGPLKLVCTGTLHEVKGQSYLLQACGRLRQEGRDIECLLIGDGPDREMLQQQIVECGLQGAAVLAGSLPRAEVYEQLRSADVLVAPSVPTRCGRREGIPVAIMEAMSCGVPVVASDLSGIPELVEAEITGLLAAPRDVTALAAAIGRLYDDASLRRRLAAAARSKVEREFDLRRNAQQLAECFQEGERP